jgi:uncharacterized membrane protein YsdA (DUF1294 family)
MPPLPFWAASYLVMSAAAFVAYGVDKRRAERAGRRIPEIWLHLLELCCGWPGALIAQQVFRHKRRKTRYLVVFWLIVALHLGAGAWLWRSSPR